MRKHIIAFTLSILIVISSCLNGLMMTTVHADTTNKYYQYQYDYLTEDQKNVYDTLLNHAYTEGGLMSGNAKISIEIEVPNNASPQDYLYSIKPNEATFALGRDHPELFWLNAYKINFESKIIENTIVLTTEGNYYFEGFTSEAQVRDEKLRFDQKIDEIVVLCNTGDRYQTLRRINKWLIENNMYNYDAATTKNYELSWSAYSAILSENVASRGPVCYGYAMGLKVLCDRLGIPIIEVEGNGFTSDVVSEGHAWNYVEMEDGAWYAIDSTWNDSKVLTNQETYFLVGADTETIPGIEKNTFSENHRAAANNYPSLAANRYSGVINVAAVNGKAFSSLQDAIDACTAGDTIKIFDNAIVKETLIVDKKIVFELDGGSIYNTSKSTVNPIVNIKDTGELTIVNKFKKSTPTYYVTGDIGQMNGDGYAIKNDGKLIIENALIQKESKMGMLILGNNYILGDHSYEVASGDSFINVDKVKNPELSFTSMKVSYQDINNNDTISNLTSYVNLHKPIITYKTLQDTDVSVNSIPEVTWKTDSQGSLKDGITYKYTAEAFGYDLQLNVIYSTSQLPKLDGEVSIIGKAEVGETLGVDLSKITSTNVGKVSYEWKRGATTIEDEKNSSYIVKSIDVGKDIKVVVNAENYSGNLESKTITVIAHQHSAASTWQSDETNHWHKCVADDGAILDKTAHTKSGWIIDTVAQEFVPGKKHTECTECKRVLETATIPATHQHSATSTWQSDETNHWHKCVADDDAILDKTAHTYGSWVVDVEANEINEGSKHHDCSECGYRETVRIPAVPHVHKPETHWDYNDISHWHNCIANDGEQINREAHIYGAWIVDITSTEIATGSKHRECITCGYKQVEEIPKLPHTHKPSGQWQSDEINHWHICGEDGEIIDKAKHIESAWIIDKVATETEKGQQHKVCTVCDKVMAFQQIDVLKPNYDYIIGKNAQWNEMMEGLIFKINGNLENFVELKINGRKIHKDNYTVQAGSVIITLKPEYLKSLKNDTYTISAIFKDGEVETNFVIKKTTETPREDTTVNTGDQTFLLLYSCTAVLSIMFAAYVYKWKKY